jgi:hypothetical protein
VLLAAARIRLEFQQQHRTQLGEKSITAQLNSSYLSQTTRFKLNLMPWKGLVISSDVSHTYWSGLSSSFNQQFVLWNAAIGYKFLKK